jgi:phosphohistidine phosphatase SixA
LGIDRVATSPYERARETAEIAIEELGLHNVDLQELDAPTPNTEPTSTRSALTGLRPADSALVTGYKPNLPRLAANLLTGDMDGLNLELPTTSLVMIDMALGTPEAKGQRVRHVPATVLRKIR